VAAATLDYKQATASVPINVQRATPVLAWPAPADITYGTALGAAQLDATASFGGRTLAGAFAYTPAAGVLLNSGNGQGLSAVFTPADTTDFRTATVTTQINVAPATPVFDSLAAPTLTYGTASTTLGGHLAAGMLMPPGNVTITLNGTTESAPIDPATGDFSASFLTSTLGAASSPYTIGYAYATTNNFAAASATPTLIVNKADQTIHWTSPADIVYGTALGAEQLDASMTSPGPDPMTGALSYSPAAGTVLHAGNGQMLTVNAGTTSNYNAATLTVTVNVAKATPTMTWASPTGIVYGTPLSAAELDATTAVAGTFTYTPAVGTVLNAGQGQTLSAMFTPDDPTDDNSVTVTVRINVAQAPLTVTADDASIAVGQPLPAFTAHHAGFVPGEGSGVLGGALTFGVPPGAAGQSGQYPITPGGLTAANYAISYVNGTLTVVAPVTVKVKGVQVQTEKLSRHKMAKVLVVSFSGALNSASAQNLAAYHLLAGKIKKRATTYSKPVPLASARYSSTAMTVTLVPRGPLNLSQPAQLRITSALVTDVSGRPIDNGRNVVAAMSKKGITLSAAADPPGIGLLSAAAVDALFETRPFAPAIGAPATTRAQALPELIVINQVRGEGDAEEEVEAVRARQET
jgi:hypothetical protein